MLFFKILKKKYMSNASIIDKSVTKNKFFRLICLYLMGSYIFDESVQSFDGKLDVTISTTNRTIANEFCCMRKYLGTWRIFFHLHLWMWPFATDWLDIERFTRGWFRSLTNNQCAILQKILKCWNFLYGLI